MRVVSIFTIDNSILNKYITIKFSRQLYLDRIYMVTQFQNYNYKHPFQIGCHKTELLEKIIKILKNNTFLAAFYERKIKLQK